MTTKLKKMNAILFSTLMITSMLAGSFAFTETVGAKESIDSGINKNNIHDGDRQFALGNQDLKASIRAFPSEETDLTAGGVYPIMYRVNTGGGGFLTSDRIENPRLTISVDQGDASITEVVSPDTSYTQFQETSDSVTLRGSSFFRTDEEHTATAFIKIPENTETNSITLSAETTTDKTTVEYTVTSGGSASSWEALAQRAEQRATFMRGYQSSYRAAVTFDDWNETYRTAMRDAMATAAIEGTKSQVIGSVPYVGTAQEARDAYQVTTGQYGGGTAGEIGRITLKLRNGLFSRIEANSVERAGNSSKPISQSIELYEAEADAWRNQNPEAALEYAQKQRAVLFNVGDVPYGGSYDKSLYFESKDQRGAADPGSDLRRFFNTLNSYSISEREHIKTEILPLARDPKPQVRTEKDSSTINNQLYDLSQGDTTNISFVVSNARSGGQTSKEGYLSFSHSPGINVTNISGIDGEVDQPVVITSNPGENINNVNNETIEANNTLIDIYESYRPGESNVYTVTVERTDAETNPWIAYRAAFERAISDGSQESFARYPTGGAYDTDQQGFSVINLTATDDPSVDALPTPVLDISKSSIQTGEQVTIDGGDSADDGQIATYEIRIDTDADGTYESVQNDVSTSRAFATAGPKRIELSVTDDSGQTATTTESVQVNPVLEVSADFSTNRSYVTPGDTIEFIATSIADSYNWDLDGDSEPERQGKRVAYTFENSGQRQITLSVADDKRGTASASGTITVEDIETRVERPDLVVDVPDDVTTGESITLDASESTARKVGDDGEITEAAITNYTWDIGGDGVDLRGERVSTEFETSGERELVVQIETETGATAVTTRTISVGQSDTTDPTPPTEEIDVDVDELTGEGTQNNPYIITNVSELQAIEHDLDATYQLGTDIDANATTNWNNGTGFDPINGFTGSLNGSDHTIIGVHINRTTNNVGLFGETRFDSEIKNLTLTQINVSGDNRVGGLVGDSDSTIKNSTVNGYISGTSYIGGVVGWNDGTVRQASASSRINESDNSLASAGGAIGLNRGTISNVSASTNIAAGYGSGTFGGLIGTNSGGTVENSSANGTVTGYSGVGGLIGSNEGFITNTSATTNVTAPRGTVGGLVGSNRGGTIHNGLASGNVSGDYLLVGGLVGDNSEGVIKGSSATSSVNGTKAVGGLVGLNSDGVITNSSASGSVRGDVTVGGLIGSNSMGIVQDAFAVGSVSGNSYVGGLIGARPGTVTDSYWDKTATGQHTSVGDATGLMTTQMVGGAARTNMTGLGFGTTWQTQSDNYPIHSWQTHDTGSNQPPSADANGPYSVTEGGSVSLDSSGSTDFGGSISEISWRIVSGSGSINSSIYSAPDSIPTNETVTVKLTVTDNDGVTATDQATVNITDVNDTGNALLSGLNYSPSHPVVGKTVSFTQNASAPNGSIQSYSWSFGDGKSSHQPNPTYTYNSSGSYSVALTVTDNDGATATRKKTINVSEQSDQNERLIVDVSGRGDYTTIQSAVDRANKGDTVEIRSGTYTEDITIGDNITLVAPNGAQVDYNGTIGSAVEFTDGAAPTISGLTITAPKSSGIDTAGADAGWMLRDITINNTDFAAIRVGADGTIEDSRIQDADVGVTRISSAAWTLKNTTIERSGTAIRALSSDSDWRLQNVTVSESDLGVNAINSESDWTIHNSTFESLAGDGVLAMGSTGEWEIHNSQIRDTSRGINAQDSTGDWDVAASQFTEVLTGIDAARSTGQWTVRKTTIESKSTAEGIEDTAPSDETAVYAAETTGTWNINQSTLVDNQVGVNATDSDAAGNATYNYWGASDGPSGDFLGGGTAAVGNISVEPFYTDTALTSLDTFEVGSDMLVNPDAPGAYDSIQTAVEASSDGDTVEVRPGTYTEPVTIQNNITLVAPDGATLDGPDSNTFGTVGIQIAPDSIAGPISPEIRGLTIEGYDSGILVGGSGDGNLVGDYSDAASGDWIVKNVTVRNSGAAGIDANEGVGDWQISGSQVVNSTYEGISADGATGEWVIEATTINHTGREGIRAINTASSWTVRDTTIKNVSDVGIDASFNSADWVVRNTTIANNEGIGFADIGGIAALDTSGDWLVTESRIENNGGVGVGLDPGDEASPVSGNWTVTETRLIENDGGGISARTATTTGNATYSYWGAPDGPSGDFNGSGAVASGNVVISPFYTDTELTTLNTESRADAITIEHNPGSATASTPTGDGRMYADQLDIFVNTDDPVAFGGQGDLRLRVVDPDTGNTVIYTPTSNARTVPLDEMYRLGIQNGGTGEPQEEILPFPESSSNLSFENINATVEGDTGIYTNETFNEYVIELVDTDGNVIDSTNNRLVGMGYEASFEQDGETGLVTRDPAVDPGWTVEFALVGDDLSIPPSEQVIDTVEVNHTEGDEHFEIPLGELDADPGEYSWTLTIVDESRAELDRERIVSISGDTQSDTGVTIRDGFGQTDPQPDVTLQSPRPASQTTPTAFNVTAEQQEPETVTLEVLDGEGTVVFEKSTDGEFENGTFATWDSTNEDGDVVADGEYDVVVTVEDQAGTEVTAEEMVPVDNTAPAIENLEIVKPAGGETNDQITVRGDISEKGTNVQFAQAAIIAESTSYIKTKDFENADVVQTALEDGTLEVTFDATAISDEVGDGDFSIGMAAVDEAGNNALVEGDLFTIDTSPPSIQPGVSGLAEDTAVLTVEAEEDVTITNLDIKAVSSESESTADRTPASYDTDITPDDPATIEFDGGALNNEDTSFTIDIEAEDAAGNADTYTLTSSISSYRIEADGTAEVDPSAVNSSFVLTTDAESSANTEREATVVQSTSAPAGTDLADNQIADEFIDVSDIGLTEAELEEADVKIPLSEIDIEGIDDDELTMLYSPDGESDYETIEPDIVEEDGQEYLVATVDGFSQLAPAGVDDEPPTIESSSVDPGTNIDLADDDDSATITFDYEDALSEIDTTATSVDVSSVDSERVSTQITKSTTEVDVTSLEDGESIGIDITVVDEAGNEVNENVSLFIDDSSAGNEEDTDGGDGSTSGGGGSISGDDDSISGDDGNTGGGDGSTGGGTNSDTSGTTSDDTDDTDDTVDTDNTDNSTTDESTDDSMDDSTGDDSSDGGTTDESSSDDGVPGGTTSDDETSEDSTPGFGAIMALVALIAAALVAARRSR